MRRTLGYDPGGRGAHGVACLDWGGDGPPEPADAKLETDTLDTPEAALDWLCDRAGSAHGIGIDTLLMWTLGDRQCDRFLRRGYHLTPGSVQAMGSLRGAMLGNGVIVAARLDGLSLFEANPKAALATGVLDAFLPIWAGVRLEPDHERDAAVAATCAALALSGVWRHDLFQGEADMFFPAGRAARYPWPEALELRNG